MPSEFEKQLGQQEELEEVEKTPQEQIDELKKKLEGKSEETIKKAAQAELMARLMNDPDYARLTQLKQSGKKAKILDENEAVVETNTKSEDEDLPADETDPKKIMAHETKKLLKQMKSVVQSELSPLKTQVEQLQGFALQERTNKAVETVKELRKKYSDFSDYEDEMVKLHQQYNGAVDAEGLYILAKTKAGKPIQTDKSTRTERPTHDTARSPSVSHTKEKKGTTFQGRRGLTELLSNGVGRIPLSFEGAEE